MILGIDPGPFESAYCLWDGRAILAKGILASNEVNFLPMQNGTVVACEHLQCFGMAVGKEVFETAYFIGELRGVCRALGITFLPIYRSEIKMFFCNSMRAKDANIRQALIDRLGGPGTKKKPGPTYGVKGDIWSALAIAVFTCDIKREAKK